MSNEQQGVNSVTKGYHLFPPEPITRSDIGLLVPDSTLFSPGFDDGTLVLSLKVFFYHNKSLPLFSVQL